MLNYLIHSIIATSYVLGCISVMEILWFLDDSDIFSGIPSLTYYYTVEVWCNECGL
jgi:hypothetical protein